MVREYDRDRFRTVVKTGAELWLQLGPEYEGGGYVRHEGMGMRMPRPCRPAGGLTLTPSHNLIASLLGPVRIRKVLAGCGA